MGTAPGDDLAAHRVGTTGVAADHEQAAVVRRGRPIVVTAA